MIIAHRGYHQNFKENTLAAFKAAFEAGADAVECDVRLAGESIVISHNDVINQNLLTLDELFYFINTTEKQFFLEVKNGSPLLAQAVINKIREHNLWSRVQIIGFWRRIKAALILQSQYPLLRVSQIMACPLFIYLKKPTPSYGAYFGWLDAIAGSRWFFKLLISPSRLKKLKQYFEKLGFKVMVGVINNPEDIKFFVESGFEDIFTDNVPAAVEILKKV